ncbi:dTDP-glucose 4,6-dehydratase [Thermococcus sp.]|uniref:dTDP-glucose 4,6-dehydratase n=1 Tax=Thermococcus sp. TaxID=35749 RepID=UPI00262DBE28|nr:dTDP-glucose 4,6-dehydratase [Thermococcus sp.]
MRLLVTGGMGFIGSNFIHYILEKHPGWEVINLDKLGYGSNIANLRDIKDDSRYTFVRGDITEFKLVKGLVKKADAVVDFAAESHVDRSISSPEHFLESNVIGTYTILEAIRKENPEVRLVHVSTDEVYGDILEGSFTEKDALMPSSPYSATKAASDVLVLGWARTYNLNASITRCTNNYGPYQFPEKLIPKTIIRASMGLKIPIYGTGQNVRDWLYVEDHVRAIERVLLKGEPREIYNISAGEERTNVEVVRTILSLMGKDKTLIEFVEDRPGHDLRYSLDPWKITRDLKWRPRYSFEEGMEKTVRWYLENEWWWRPLVNEKVLHPTPWKLGW